MKTLILISLLLTACGADDTVSIQLEETGPRLCPVDLAPEGMETYTIDGQLYVQCVR